MEMIYKLILSKYNVLLNIKSTLYFLKKTIFKCFILSKISKTNISKRIFSKNKKMYSAELTWFEL